MLFCIAHWVFLCRLKNVSFEITATDVGVFDVSAKFLGVSMEKVELVFQVSYHVHKRGLNCS